MRIIGNDLSQECSIAQSPIVKCPSFLTGSHVVAYPAASIQSLNHAEAQEMTRNWTAPLSAETTKRLQFSDVRQRGCERGTCSMIHISKISKIVMLVFD